MNGAALLTRTLRNAGVETVFSLSGNQIMPVFDASIDDNLRLIHTRHEAGAVYMADSFAQVTGGLGVALITAAPGFANALSAVYSARMNESPVLFLSGDSPVGENGNAPFQELDQCAMAAPVVKYTARPQTPEELGEMLAEAIRIALSGRPGPVHIALPFDVLNATVSPDAVPSADALVPPVQELTEAGAVAAALGTAKRPVILVGPALNEGRGGGRAEALRKATGAPVICLESPRGLRDPALGAFVEVLNKADLVLGIGKVPDFTNGFMRPPAVAENLRLMFIDSETAALDRAKSLGGERVEVMAQADAAASVDALLKICEPMDRADWLGIVDDAVTYRTDPATAPGIHPRAVCKGVQDALDAADEAILICDGGEFGQWAQALVHAPMRVTNGLSGAIGGGTCYAIGAKVARPDATVIVLMGDGTAGFYLAEFDTAVREKVAFTAVIGNDSCWNAEHHIQLRDYGENRTVGCTLNPDARYDLAAAGLGCHGANVTEESGFPAALQTALASGKTACLDVRIASLAAPVFRRT